MICTFKLGISAERMRTTLVLVQLPILCLKIYLPWGVTLSLITIKYWQEGTDIMWKEKKIGDVSPFLTEIFINSTKYFPLINENPFEILSSSNIRMVLILLSRSRIDFSIHSGGLSCFRGEIILQPENEEEKFQFWISYFPTKMKFSRDAKHKTKDIMSELQIESLYVRRFMYLKCSLIYISTHTNMQHGYARANVRCKDIQVTPSKVLRTIFKKKKNAVIREDCC